MNIHVCSSCAGIAQELEIDVDLFPTGARTRLTDEFYSVYARRNVEPKD